MILDVTFLYFGVKILNVSTIIICFFFQLARRLKRGEAGVVSDANHDLLEGVEIIPAVDLIFLK